ncbi:MAG: glycosyltransferase family 2 protein [Chthoniobacterales bacterium]|nr:glycosyltransferase family 2 protein [Chthoniobacterales bacterium]
MFFHREVKKKIQQSIQQGYDTLICTPERLMHQSIKRCPEGSRKVSVAIPHWNRGALIHRPLWNIVNDERIEEIVIVDDGSSEEEFSLLVKNVARYDRRKVVTIHRREENKGVQFTKVECVEKICGAWMILLDSDNTLFPSYLDAVVALQHLDEKSLYCPDWAFPYFWFRQVAGQKIDFQKACYLIQQGTLQKISLLNDGNYFFHKATYLAQLLPLKQIQHDVADVMLANYRWLSQGGSLTVMQQARYLHRIDDSSFWMRTSQESRRRVMSIFDRFKNNLPWDGPFASTII